VRFPICISTLLFPLQPLKIAEATANLQLIAVISPVKQAIAKSGSPPERRDSPTPMLPTAIKPPREKKATNIVLSDSSDEFEGAIVSPVEKSKSLKARPLRTAVSARKKTVVMNDSDSEIGGGNSSDGSDFTEY
jgi:hypothetical protein